MPSNINNVAKRLDGKSFMQGPFLGVMTHASCRDENRAPVDRFVQAAVFALHHQASRKMGGTKSVGAK
jgi:hypothetical protein